MAWKRNDGYRLYLDGQLVIDNWIKRSYGGARLRSPWAADSRHDIRLEYFESTGNARLRVLWDAGVTDESSAQIDSAVAVARESDAVIVVAGLEEGEFRDRARLSLPGRQEDLIQAIARTGKPTIVVLIGGSAITMSPWLDQVDAVLDAWYPGEAGGPAVADVLFGDANPSGRLPSRSRSSKGNCRCTTTTSRRAAATTTTISRACRCSHSASV